jgi:hypothetical protein
MLRVAAVIVMLLFAEESAADPATLMAGLLPNLERVRSSDGPSEHLPDPIPDVSELAGLSKSEIRAGLGPATACVLEDDASYRQAECAVANQWFYSFYKLPPESVGGGLELVFRFSANGVCSSAEWLHTQ